MKYRFRRLRCALIVSAIAICGGCSTVPYSNRSQLLLTSQTTENQLGAEAWAEIKRTEKLSTNATAIAALNRVGKRIAAAANQPGFEWEFRVIESEAANAFCLPGGKVALYTGILPYMDNDAEMAVVVSHEVSHAIARHGGERMTQAGIQSFGAAAVSEIFQDSANKDVALGVYGATTTLGGILPYSRLHESEADSIGMMLMARAGYDPAYAITFWQKFGGSSGGFIEAFTSTHPLGTERVKAMRKALPEAQKIYQAAHPRYGAGEKF